MMTPAEVAERLGLHVYTIRRMIHDGRIPASRMGTGTHARLGVVLSQIFIKAKPH